MVATQFPKGVQLFEAPGCNTVAESLATGSRALQIERACKRSPRMRRVFRQMFESTRPQDIELSEALGLRHIQRSLYEAAPAASQQVGLLGMSSNELLEAAAGLPPRNLIETWPQATPQRAPGSKRLLDSSSDELLDFALGH